MDLLQIIKALTDFGFQTLLTAFFFFFAYKFIDQKYFAKQKAEVYRKYNADKDEEENRESKERLKKLQLYLEENSERIFNKGIDRVSVWLNHNGMRNGKIHFIFYSLIAEITKQGLQKFMENPIGSQKLPYYVFADYEEMIIKQNWPVFIKSVIDELKGASGSISKDLWTKSLIVAPIYNLRGGIDGLIFFSSVFTHLEDKPKLDNLILDIRALFIA